MPGKFYLTTPIYYVNARPHIGHAYTTIVADVLARRHRLLGDDTWFLTGTDEHGQKIERSALAAGIPPQQFADQVSASFKTLWDRMGLTYDQYIRTTDEAHKRGVQKVFTTLQERGAIYLDSYTGAYCVSDEAFVDVPVGAPCPDCGRITETVTEENYFFKLSEYQLPLLNLIESNELLIEPEARRNEVLSFLRGNFAPTFAEIGKAWADKQMSVNELFGHAEKHHGALKSDRGHYYLPGTLRDLSISRSSFTWGIPVPKPTLGAPGLASETWEGPPQPTAQDHVIYVWLDALANYMTAVGYGDESEAGKEKFARYWPADLHIVGKEIIRFHCVYWPAFLLAAGIALPKKVVAHGWLLFEDSKMSKSKGNIVRTETILDAFGALCPTPPSSLLTTPSSKAASLSHRSAAEGSASLPDSPTPSPHHRDLFAADVLRYFLLREIPFGQDGSFSFDALITRYNADLANGYGNLVSRTLGLIQQNFSEGLSKPKQPWLCPDRQVFRAENMPTQTNEAESGSRFIITRIDEFIQLANEELWPSNKTQIYLAELALRVSHVDHYLSFHKPWMLAKSLDQTDKAKLVEVLYIAADSIRRITILLHPIIPYATTRVWQQLGLDPAELETPNSKLSTLEWGLLPPGTKLGPLGPIFPRADKGLAQIMADMELPRITTQHDASTPRRTICPPPPSPPKPRNRNSSTSPSSNPQPRRTQPTPLPRRAPAPSPSPRRACTSPAPPPSPPSAPEPRPTPRPRPASSTPVPHSRRSLTPA